MAKQQVANRKVGADEPPNKVPLTAAPPQWHTLSTWVAVVAVCVACFPSNESIDELATVENFSTVVFPEFLDLQSVIYIRLLISLGTYAIIVFMSSLLAHMT